METSETGSLYEKDSKAVIVIGLQAMVFIAMLVGACIFGSARPKEIDNPGCTQQTSIHGR